MKKILNFLKEIFYNITLFFVVFIITYMILNLFVEIFINVNVNINYLFLFIITIIISIILTILIFIKLKLSIFYQCNKAFVVFHTIILILGFTLSIKPTLEMTLDDAKELMELIWTLFAILSAILVAWTIVVKQEISGNNLISHPVGSKRRIENIDNKISKSNTAFKYFLHFIFVMVPVLCALTLTPSVLVMKNIDYLEQTIIYTCVYITPFNLLMITIDTVGPTITLLGEKTLTKEDIHHFSEEIKKGKYEDDVIKIFDEIIDKKDYTEEEKNKLRKDFLEKIANIEESDNE